jgi:hypothetical protein
MSSISQYRYPVTDIVNMIFCSSDGLSEVNICVQNECVEMYFHGNLR